MILAAASGCGAPTCKDASETWLNDYVSQRRCTRDTEVVTIYNTQPNTELWVLEEPRATSATRCDAPDGCDPWLLAAPLNDSTFLERSQALVQVNGYNFNCEGGGEGCYELASQAREQPISRVYESSFWFARNPDGLSDWPLSFGPRSASGIPIQLGNAHEEPAYKYNVVGSNSPVIQGGECNDWFWDSRDVTVIGYGAAPDSAGPIVVMVYVKQGPALQELCALMKELGVRDAVMMDGSESAGIYLNADGGTQGLGNFDKRRIPYRIGLVTLEESNRVINGGFESPDLATRESGTPSGFHSYGVGQVEVVQWEGAMDLYNTPIYNRRARQEREQRLTLPSHDAQVAVIRYKGFPNNFIQQRMGVPANRYCMLHFFHGYNKPPGCYPPLSKLFVRVEDCHGNWLTSSEYSSPPTNGPGASLQEAWLRILTPDGYNLDPCIQLSFVASGTEHQGACGVLVDDISVSCVQ